MGFDVFGPTRHVRASNVDDGAEPRYDLLALAQKLGLRCSQLFRAGRLLAKGCARFLREKLHQRFYESTTVSFADGEIHALAAELIALRGAYRARREPELIAQHRIGPRDRAIRQAILEQLLQRDTVYCALEEFGLLCEEAIAALADVRAWAIERLASRSRLLRRFQWNRNPLTSPGFVAVTSCTGTFRVCWPLYMAATRTCSSRTLTTSSTVIRRCTRPGT